MPQKVGTALKELLTKPTSRVRVHAFDFLTLLPTSAACKCRLEGEQGPCSPLGGQVPRAQVQPGPAIAVC